MDTEANTPNYKEEIKKFLYDELGVETPENFQDDQPLRDQLQLDSMDLLDLLRFINQSYQRNITPMDFYNLPTMNHIVAYLEDPSTIYIPPTEEELKAMEEARKAEEARIALEAPPSGPSTEEELPKKEVEDGSSNKREN